LNTPWGDDDGERLEQPRRAADPICVSRAEAELALDRFPRAENPFAELVKPKETVELFSHLTVVAPAPSEIETAHGRRRARARIRSSLARRRA
jgi:hypothetical protein